MRVFANAQTRQSLLFWHTQDTCIDGSVEKGRIMRVSANAQTRLRLLFSHTQDTCFEVTRNEGSYRTFSLSQQWDVIGKVACHNPHFLHSCYFPCIAIPGLSRHTCVLLSIQCT